MTGHAYPHGPDRPRIDPTAYIAPGARIVGDVTIGPRASIWFNAVLRADNDAITIGAETNIQDGAVVPDWCAFCRHAAPRRLADKGIVMPFTTRAVECG